MILLGISYKSDILIIQSILVLEKKEILIDKVCWIRPDAPISERTITFLRKKNIIINHDFGPSITHLNTEESYHYLQSYVLSWYRLNKDESSYVFIGGGHKFYSLAMQKASYLLGATDVFHMLYDGERGEEPTTVKEIKKALSLNKIKYISLGKETGWPALKNLSLSKDDDLLKFINGISNNISQRSIDEVNEYPFESLNLVSQNAINWLNNPLEYEDRQWLESIPKVELHCHLGGFATHGELLEKVRNASLHDLPPKKNIGFPENWPLNKTNISLKEYMNLGDNNGSYILSDQGCLEKQVELLYTHFIENNIIYAEVRCSPYNYTKMGLPGEKVLEIIMNEFNLQMSKNITVFKRCHVNLILIATRKDVEHKNKLSQHIELCAKYSNSSNEYGLCKVVGIDLAGWEHPSTRPSNYKEEFLPIHRNGIAVTIHAGENDTSESIWQSVFDLNTRRIGHGLNLLEDEKLLSSVVNRKIGIEMCPVANYQIVGFMPKINCIKQYPLLFYLSNNAHVTINTDNIGISNSNLVDNFILLIELCPGITRMDCLRLIRNGIEQAFIDQSFRNSLIKEMNMKVFNLFFRG